MSTVSTSLETRRSASAGSNGRLNDRSTPSARTVTAWRPRSTVASGSSTTTVAVRGLLTAGRDGPTDGLGVLATTDEQHPPPAVAEPVGHLDVLGADGRGNAREQIQRPDEQLDWSEERTHYHMMAYSGIQRFRWW